MDQTQECTFLGQGVGSTKSVDPHNCQHSPVNSGLISEIKCNGVFVIMFSNRNALTLEVLKKKQNKKRQTI